MSNTLSVIVIIVAILFGIGLGFLFDKDNCLKVAPDETNKVVAEA